MKRFFLLALVTATIISCDVRRKDKIADDIAARTEQALKDSTIVQIIDTTYNFGKIMEGEKVTYSFRFKNVGKKPLVISKTTASCGCTVPEKPEQPILPGESGFIKVVFNSNHKVGHNEKSITVMSNANPAFPPLLLIGEVVEAKK